MNDAVKVLLAKTFEIKTKLHLTHVALAKVLGVTGQTVYRWSKGRFVPKSLQLEAVTKFVKEHEGLVSGAKHRGKSK